jgi:hypothetical protein
VQTDRGPRLPRGTRTAWAQLAGGTEPALLFDPARSAALPAPVQRWLGHTLSPGVPLGRRAEVVMTGRIRLGRWRPFTARQILAPPDGLVWAARTRFGPLPVVGFDRYVAAAGRMRWRLAGLIPVVSATGPDVTRSAAGRLAGEALILPQSALAPWVRWRPGDDGRATAEVTLDEGRHPVAVSIDDAGRLETLALSRWGNPEGRTYAEHTFGVRFDGEQRIAGVTVARTVTAGWDWDGTGWANGPFFTATFTDMRFL